MLVAYFAGKFPAPHSAHYAHWGPSPLTRPAFLAVSAVIGWPKGKERTEEGENPRRRPSRGGKSKQCCGERWRNARGEKGARRKEEEKKKKPVVASCYADESLASAMVRRRSHGLEDVIRRMFPLPHQLILNIHFQHKDVDSSAAWLLIALCRRAGRVARYVLCSRTADSGASAPERRAELGS